ncbi:MAG: M48 family metalloprotease [Deltaproteobacteria bacterium]|nr:M48 family metalloprotease [Deltaproteobacteria bacterium]MBW2661138.1 M48 family metalloprotease [Deltaproteobacteria bacterium]
MFIKKLIIIYSLVTFIAFIGLPKEALCITVKEEEELSRQVMKVVQKHFEFVEDPLIVNYVNKVGKKIVSILPPQPFTYKFYIIKEDVYNAFATPAGNIFINSGLLEAMDNEDELAGILGHEIAHVVCRHISQKIERSKKIGLATLAGIAAGIFLGTGGGATAASAVSIGSMAAGQSLSLAYSREDEIQADQLGLTYTAKAGYSAAGLLAMLNKIRNRQWFGSKQIPTYLTTHPAVEDRIIYISSRLGNNAKKTGQTSIKTHYDFEIAHTRIISIYGDENRALRKFKTDVKNYPSSPMAHYGYGLILARTDNRKDAISHLKTALKKAAFDPNILKDLGRIYFLDGQYSEAFNALNSAISLIPDDSEALFFLGRTQIELEEPDKAVLTFEKLISINPDYTKALYFLGETYGKQEKLDKAHYYLGTYYKNKKQYKNARFHLYRALKIIKDQNKRQQIEKMLKEIRKNETEMRKETY